MRITTVIFLCLFVAGTTAAQDAAVVTDTLDWRRYYPLEVGNTWEYGGLNDHTRTIVGDTLANGHQYFVRRDSTPASGPVGPFIHTFYVRYDTAGTVVTLKSLEEDTVEVPLPLDSTRVAFPDFLAHFDMRMAFGDTLYYGANETLDTLYDVQGGYSQTREIGPEFVDVDALKCFRALGPLLYGECYATDIGLVGSGNLFSADLEYARVGGIEYGHPSTRLEAAAEMPERLSIETIHPNPFRDKAAVTYRVAKPTSIKVEVFNVLGQRIWWEQTSVHPAGEGRYDLESRTWPAGVYHVSLSTESGAQSVRPVVVVD